MNKQARDILCDIWREYFNDYLTPETYADCNGLTVSEAKTLLCLARQVESHPHPES